MIPIKNKNDLNAMRVVCRHAAHLLDYLEPFIKPGISTQDLDDLAVNWIKERSLKSAILNYHGFPKSICTSVNEVVCHGIPSPNKILLEGDIVNVDVTLILNNYYGDTSRTFIVGEASKETTLLVQRTKKALLLAIESVAPEKPIGIIGDVIEDYVKDFGYSIITALGGHGIGKKFHEEPFVYHHRRKKKGAILKKGMVFTIEPMINAGENKVYTDAKDGWSVISADNSLSAQFEHTVAITETGSEILTTSEPLS